MSTFPAGHIFNDVLDRAIVFYKYSDKVLELREYVEKELGSLNFKDFDELIKMNKTNFYVELIHIRYLFKKGKVSESKKRVRLLIEKIISRKALPRINDIYIFFEGINTILPMRGHHNIKSGRLEDVDNLEEYFNLVDFSEIKYNPNIYLKHGSFIKHLVENIKLYNSSEIIELVLKSAQFLTFDKTFFKALELIAHEIGSKKLGDALKKISESEGQSFGMNIDALTNIEEHRSSLLDNQSLESIDIKLPIPKVEKILVDDTVTLEESIKIHIANEDYISALAAIRESFEKGNYSEELYFYTLKEMSHCYEKLGMFVIAEKIKSFIKLKKPSYDSLKREKHLI